MHYKYRRKLFVDRQVQGTLLYRIIIYWCFAVLAICLMTLCVQAVAHPNRPFFDYFAFGQFFVDYWAIILTSLVLVPLIMLDVVTTSNRFVGPLFRMRRSMRELASGQEVEPIHFREKDFWKEVANEFNLVLAYVDELKTELAEARAKLDEAGELETAEHK